MGLSLQKFGASTIIKIKFIPIWWVIIPETLVTTKVRQSRIFANACSCTNQHFIAAFQSLSSSLTIFHNNLLLYFYYYIKFKIINMEAYLIVLIAVMSVVLLAINIYLLILYIHPDDKGWGTAIHSKILIVLGLTLCQAQALMIPLDVANRSAILPDSIDMATFWFFLYIVVLCFVCVLLPYSIFLYETDEDQPICSRLLKALGFTMGAIIISALIVFISWIFLKYADLPYTQIAVDVNQIGTSSLAAQTQTQQSMQIQVSLVVYIIAVLSFFGWIFLVLFGGVGLFALPIDLINQFRHRPVAKKTGQMQKTKNYLVKAINLLEKQGKELKQLDQKMHSNQQAGCFQSFRGKRSMKTRLSEYRTNYYAIVHDFELFQNQIDLEKSNPVVPFLKLLLGIFFLLTSLVWIVQIIIGNIIKGFNNDRPLVPMLNQMFIGLENANAGFVSTGIFTYLCLYMLWCVQKGNIKFGMRIPCCCRFHPMKKNQTWMNSFLFNVILLLIASVGVIQLCISSFPTYTRNTQIYMIFSVQILYMRFYNVFYKNNVFVYAFVGWAIISLIYLLVTCNKKPKYMQGIEQIRQRQIQT